jgi:protein MpaA
VLHVPPFHASEVTAVVAIITSIAGYSTEHRAIELVHVPGPGPRVLVVGSIHGDETAGAAVVAALRRVHPREDLWLIPTLNPDGVARGTRQNARGVDLNRNFVGPGSFSEPETRVARDVILRLRPRVTIWFHQHLNLVWAYGRSSAPGARYARLAGMRYRHRRWLAGTGTNWQNHLRGGGASFTVELPAGRLDADGLRRQVRAVLRVALAAP